MQSQHLSDPEMRRVHEALEAFRVGTGTEALTFEGRLARENGWSLAFAHRVMDEYRRFLFLARFAGHEVTPSDEVDQAWHLHLTYTRSYWEDLCGQVLGRPLHHGPTRGGVSEDARYEGAYARTLASYERFFGEPAPADVWPAGEERFQDARRFRRIDTSRVWLLPRPGRRGALLASALLSLAAWGCVPASGPPLLSVGAGAFIFFAIFSFIMVFVILATVSASKRGSMGRGGRRGGRRGGHGRHDWGGSAMLHDHDSDDGFDRSSSGFDSSGCGSSGCGGGCGGGGD